MSTIHDFVIAKLKTLSENHLNTYEQVFDVIINTLNEKTGKSYTGNMLYSTVTATETLNSIISLTIPVIATMLELPVPVQKQAVKKQAVKKSVKQKSVPVQKQTVPVSKPAVPVKKSVKPKSVSVQGKEIVFSYPDDLIVIGFDHLICQYLITNQLLNKDNNRLIIDIRTFLIFNGILYYKHTPEFLIENCIKASVDEFNKSGIFANDEDAFHLLDNLLKCCGICMYSQLKLEDGCIVISYNGLIRLLNDIYDRI